jgi:hypothetical protein
MKHVWAWCLLSIVVVACGSPRRDDLPEDCSDTCDFEDEVVCDGEMFRQCARKSDGCLAWRAAQACPGDGVCDSSKNQCVSKCSDQCEEDAFQCTDGGKIRFCQRGGSGCLEWGAADFCSSGNACDAERGGCAPCEHTCKLGESTCSGAQVSACKTDTNGCRVWGAPANCPSSQTCEPASGTCSGSCQSDCAQAGATRCSGAQVQVCQKVNQTCLRWGTPSNCVGSSTCDSNLGRCNSDPCNGVPTEGRCSGTSTIEYCAVSTGSGQPELKLYDCPVGEQCSVANGIASCELVGSCRPGTVECVNVNQRRGCSDNGTWQTESCGTGTCRDSALGAYCAPAVASRYFNGTLSYDVRAPNDTLTDWDTQLYTATMSNMLVLSFSGEDFLDITTTDENGAFKIRVPSSPASTDRVVAVAANADSNGDLIFFVANPGHSTTGVHSTDDIGAKPNLWSWAWQTNTLGASADLQITEADGSGAARIFDYLRYAYYTAQNEFGGKSGLSMVAWVGYGTSWDCGACFAPWPISTMGFNMQSQIWFPADSNQSFWADSVTAHELGHWVMSSYSTSPNEGGTHYLGNPTFPGQAWSEGWATWFSAAIRNDSYYVDKQGGSMFWSDIDSRSYGSGTTWQRPKPANGLLQRIDENEVSSMMWSLSNSSQTAFSKMMTGLGSPKMNKSPWARGYTRHTWDMNGASFTNVNDTRVSAPMLADYLDTLMCSGFTKTVIDAATNPTTAYPFPSNAPICQ